jgi:predicted DNA-binding protein
MAYDDKAHRHEHQVKVRLDDEVFQELKDVARDMKLQHSVLSREIIEAALEVRRALGELPFELEKRQA